jgi:predicted PurR-regulated permease PerM
MTAQRVVEFRTRTVLRTLLMIVALALTLEVVWIARHVITWMVIALFLALALDPFVSWIQRRTHLGRGSAIGVAYVLVLIVVALVGWTFIPKLIDEVNGFVQALPHYVHQLTHGRGRLGFLERKYHIVEKVRQQVQKGGATRVLGLSGAAISVTKSIISIVAAVVTIVFLTFFMLLEGRAWVERLYTLLPESSQPRWRQVGHDIYRTVGGYVTGNILISLIAGAGNTVVLLIMGVPYAVALGLLVAFLDLIPLAGATIAGVIVALVAFLHSVPAGIVVVIFFVVYQQIENHILQPVIYGRTVQLSPLAVLVAVLVGAELAGIIGALAAIPVAGALQVLIRDQLVHHRAPAAAVEAPPGIGPPVPET